MTKLIEMEGVGPVYAEALQKAGVGSIEALLEKGATPAGRNELALASQISGKLILEWVNRADLFRIKGVGSEYSDLLEEAGVDTVVELAHRDPKSLFDKMVAVNAEKNLVRKLPALSQVQSWVAQAKLLPRKIHY